ncbi:MAG: VTT domain-containing protein [Patescibacteria group bacterium]
MFTLSHIQHFVELNANIAYLLIFLGVIIEGEIIVVIAGIFAHLGSLNIFIAFIATMIGGGSKSVIGYIIGYYLQKNHSGKPVLRYAEHRVNYFLPKFEKKPFWSIFLSRFLILGLHWFTLLFAGYKKIRLRTFAEAELGSLLVWSTSVLALGYFFSYTALSISRDIRKFLIIILLFFIAFFVLEQIVAFIIELWESKGDKNNKKE